MFDFGFNTLYTKEIEPFWTITIHTTPGPQHLLRKKYLPQGSVSLRSQQKPRWAGFWWQVISKYKYIHMFIMTSYMSKYIHMQDFHEDDDDSTMMIIFIYLKKQLSGVLSLTAGTQESVRWRPTCRKENWRGATTFSMFILTSLPPHKRSSLSSSSLSLFSSSPHYIIKFLHHNVWFGSQPSSPLTWWMFEGRSIQINTFL